MVAFVIYQYIKSKKFYVTVAILFVLTGVIVAYNWGASSENIRFDIWGVLSPLSQKIFWE